MDVDGCIVVGVDGSPDESGLRWAAAEAGRRHVGLVIAHGGGHPLQLALSPDTRRAAESEIQLFGEAVVQAAEMTVVSDVPDVPVRTFVSTDSAARMLIDMSERAELVVVSAGAHGRGRRWALGSVAEHVAGHARGPVAVIKSNDHGVHANLVVAGIGSRGDGEQILRYACTEARARNAGVLAVHAWGAAELVAAVGLGYVGAALKELEHYSGVALHALVELVAADFGDVPISTRLIQSNASFAVAQAAEYASVLVVGTGCAPDSSHPRLSRVASTAMHRCACPVIVLPRVPADATASAIR